MEVLSLSIKECYAGITHHQLQNIQLEFYDQLNYCITIEGNLFERLLYFPGRIFISLFLFTHHFFIVQNFVCFLLLFMLVTIADLPVFCKFFYYVHV